MKSQNIFLFIFAILNSNLCDDTQLSVPHIKQYIKPGDIYSLDITKFVDLQTNSVDFRSNVDYAQLPGFSKETKSLSFQGVNFDPIEVKYSKGSFFILQGDQKNILKFSQQTLQLENSFTDQINQEDPDLLCHDIILKEQYLWVLCKKDLQNEDGNQSYKIITIDHLQNLLIADTQFFGPIFQNPKFKMTQLTSDKSQFAVFDQRYKSSTKFENEQTIQIVDCQFEQQKEFNIEGEQVKQEVYRSQSNAISLKLSPSLKKFFKEENFKFKIINAINDMQRQFSLFVIQQEGHNGKYVFSCQLKNEFYCEKFLDEKVVHFFYKDSNYLYVDESLVLRFCVLKENGKSECREGIMKKNWKVIGINLESNRGLVVVEDSSDYYVFVNDYSTGYFNWYKDDFNGVKKVQLFQSEILDKNHHVYFMLKFKGETCELQNLTFNKDLVIDSAKIKDNQNIKIYLGNIEVLNIEMILWDGQSLINYLDQTKVNVALNSDQLYAFKMPWITQAPQFVTNEIQQIENFDQVKFVIIGMTTQQSKFHLQNSVMIQHNKKLYAFQENLINVFSIKDFNLYNELVLQHEQKIEHDLLKDSQLKNLEKHGNIILFKDFNDNNLTTYNFDDNMINNYEFQHDEQLSNCLVNSDFLICSQSNEEQIFQKMSFYKFKSNMKVELDEESTELFNKQAEQFIKIQTNSQEFSKIQISDFDLDSCNDEKFVIVYNLYQQNVQKPLLAEIKIKKQNKDQTSFTFKQIFQNDLNAGDITADDKIYQYNGQTIVVQSEPVFKVFMQKNQSYSELPFLESSQVKIHQINKDRGLLAVIYKSSFNQEYYIALYQLTSNALMQLVANQNIQQLDMELEYPLQINITSISQTHVLINILKEEDNINLMSFVYNQTGPILYTKDLTNEIIINNQGVVIESNIDKELIVQDYVYVKDEILKVEEFKDQKFNLKDFVSIQGNVENIQIKSPELNQTSFKVVKMQDSIQQFHLLDFSVLHQYCYKCMLSDTNIISSYSEKNQNYTLTDINNLQATTLGNNKCIDFDYDHLNKRFICLKTQSNNIGLSIYLYQQSKDNKEQQNDQIEVPFDSVSVKLIHSTITHQIYQVENSQKNKITFISLDSENQLNHHITIDGKQLQSDLLFIKDNYSFVQNFNQQKLLNTIVYDQRANKIYLNSVDLMTAKSVSFVNRVVDLNVYESQTYKMNCQHTEADLECYLIGKLNIYRLNIYKETNNGFNKFNWIVNQNHTYKNALYDQADDINYDPIIVFSDVHLILANKNSQNIDDDNVRIIHYYKNNVYSDYVYQIADHKVLVDLQINQKGNTQLLEVLLKNQLEQIEVQILTLNPDTNIIVSQSNQKALMEKRQMKVKFINGTNLYIDFQIVNNADFINDDSKSFFQRHWISIICVLILCLTAFFLLIVLLVLLRERKKINMRMAMLNEGNSNVPLTDI